jgi:hypothetical protein
MRESSREAVSSSSSPSNSATSCASLPIVGIPATPLVWASPFRRRRVVDAVGCNLGAMSLVSADAFATSPSARTRRRDTRSRGGEWQCGAHSLHDHRFLLPPNRRARARHRSTRGRDRRSRARGTRRRWRCSCRSRSPGRRPCGRRAPRAGRSLGARSPPSGP